MDQKTEPQLTQLAELMQTECSNMLRYACCRLGDREEARDALQDVYLSVHSQICGDHGIRILDLKSYFFRILANHCIELVLMMFLMLLICQMNIQRRIMLV